MTKKFIFSFGATILTVMLFTNIFSVSADEYFDSYYGEISWEDEQMHLDNFAIHLKKNPEDKGYIAFFTGKNEKPKTIKKRIERARKYLIEVRNIPQNQLSVINAGKDKRTKIILQPVSKTMSPPKFRSE